MTAQKQAQHTPLDLAQFEGHTPGPWVADAACWSESGFAQYELIGITLLNAPDSRLIAASPALLSECRRLRAENARLREALENAANVISLGLVNQQWPSESSDEQDSDAEVDSVLTQARAALRGQE